MPEEVFDGRAVVSRDNMCNGTPCRVFGKVRAVEVKPEQVGQRCCQAKHGGNDQRIKIWHSVGEVVFSNMRTVRPSLLFHPVLESSRILSAGAIKCRGSGRRSDNTLEK